MKLKTVGIVSLLPLAAAWAGEGYVADPYRAVNLTWPKHACCGQDYRFLLPLNTLALENEIMEDGTPVKDLPFFKEAGIFNVDYGDKLSGGDRRIELKSVKGFDATGKEVKVKMRVTSSTRDALVEPAAGGTIVSAPLLDTFERWQAVHAKIELTGEQPIAVVKIVSPDLDKTQLEQKIATPAKRVVVQVATQPSRYVATAIKTNAKMRERMERAPFSVAGKHRGYFGLKPQSIDLTEMEKSLEPYGERYLGTEFGEWDAMFLYRLARPYSVRQRELARLGRFPCNREQMVHNLKAFWDQAHSQLGKRMWGMCAAYGMDAYGPEWGGSVIGTEFTDPREKPFRNWMMRMRGASRQFDKPTLIYTAYYRQEFTCDSRPFRIAASHGTMGVDFGQEPSLSLRSHYMTYYMGNNYQCFECMPWGQFIRRENGRLGLTKNGEAMKSVYDWYKSGKGERGESYAPILLLGEGLSALDNLDWMHVGEKSNGGAFKCGYPGTDADFLEKYINEAITPYYNPNVVRIGNFTPDYSANMRNSTLGDVFDYYTATPIVKRHEPTLKQIERYPVALAMHDLRWTESLANTIKQYVANGGTFVATTAQVAPFADDPAFLGVTSFGARVVDGEILVDQVKLAGAQVVRKTANGRPLVLKNAFMNGHVVLIASPFFRKVKNRDVVPTELVKLLEDLQAETVPFKVKGLCEAMYNHCADGSWRVVLINNAGVEKNPKTSDDPKRPEFAAKLELTVPAGARAEEIRVGAKMTKIGTDTYAITVPPGEVCVVKVTGVGSLAARSFAEVPAKPVTPFGEMPYVESIRNDGYRFEPGAAVPVPEVIGAWKGENGFRDSSPNGHDMKLINGAKVVDGKLVTDVDMSAGKILFKCDYAIPEATYDMYVTPNANCKNGGVFGKASHCYVADMLKVLVDNGRWRLNFWTEAYGSDDRIGPKVEPRRTRITLTLKKGFVRFYVDGQEVVSPRGPIKFRLSPEARDDFYKQVYLYFGATCEFPNSTFDGTCESLTFTSKAIVP